MVDGARPLARGEVEGFAARETARMVDALRALSPDEWTRPTDCPAWDVRALAGHVLGMTEGFSGLRRMVSTMVAGARRADGGPMIDGITAAQVAANADLSTGELVDRMAAAGPRQARWRASRRLLRLLPDKEPMRDGTVETWRMGYIFDVILTRDTWMHRVDIARATGRPHELTAEHDGRIVADVVVEWARRHGEPFALRLTGPAGGTFSSGSGGVELTLDAAEFCRILSGRAPGEGLLAREVPF
ncbi:maleylpyruvate isomerase family mycothiol-dependent enzyme [Pseudonocardia sp.]|uniref:maleylpyruvate isomerase family mycothiol-dependent enzyme n=1 Tax=Pseudonocardia sp. TaxID=60912 RepID=UPI003D119D45